MYVCILLGVAEIKDKIMNGSCFIMTTVN